MLRAKSEAARERRESHALDEAELILDEARNLAHQRDSLLHQLRVANSRVRLMALRNRTSPALDDLAEIYAQFVDAFDTIELKTA